MEKLTKWITSSGCLMGLLAFAIGNPLTDLIVTATIKVGAWVVGALFFIMRKVFRVSFESLLVRLMKLPFIREMTVNVMVMMKPMMKGLEPEALYVCMAFMRIRGVKEVILPVIMSTGVLVETLAAPEVIARLGRKKKS